MTLSTRVSEIIDQSVKTHEALKGLVPQIERFVKLARQQLEFGGKIILFGDGGSMADSQHIAAEFVNLPVIALTNISTMSAIANDDHFSETFSKQVRALCKEKGPDLVVALSTSGESENVVRGIVEANRMFLKTVALTGGTGGRLAKKVDLAIIVPSTSTPRIQECHELIGHILWEYLVL